MAIPHERQVVQVLRYPDGLPREADFGLDQRPLPALRAGEVLLRTQWLSIDPYLRPLLAGRYAVPRPALGAMVPGGAVSQVVQSTSDRFAVGDWVVGDTGWCDYAVAAVDTLRRVDPDLAPLSTALGVLGIPGLTAWAGLKTIGRPQPGDTVLVSTAAGAVGSVAGQLARLAGCRTVGIAGLPEKCAIARDAYGFDECVSHLSPTFNEDLRTACPEGIDVYFDNVGGPVLEAALSLLRPHARVVLCGLSAQYNQAERPPGPNLGPVIGARATLQGLVVFDHLARFDEFTAEVAPLVRDGSVQYRESISDGLAAAPAAFVATMSGQNLGKSLVRLAS
ncbi:NADP-dependent oxidoreductase [Lysobacter sp. A03]|uniref:NADP-dependent oxidoreductase n=1 Tax=Lysobacter sp. A03 TaxID=1199154 RepID=UPI0005B6AD58|nr:NADP-dependent oxidoreductase [Lysobacter sp. A03]KIQ96695.1 putative oxidoreductase YncB [Lysobacter sp. A03]